MDLKYLLFTLERMNDFFDVFIDFKINLTEGNLIRKCV